MLGPEWPTLILALLSRRWRLFQLNKLIDLLNHTTAHESDFDTSVKSEYGDGKCVVFIDSNQTISSRPK